MKTPRPQYSRAVKQEIAIALEDYMASSSVGHDRMATVCDRVCTESHAMHLSQAEMEQALRGLFNELPGGSHSIPDQELRRAVFDLFLHGCVEAYIIEERKERPAGPGE